MAESSSNMPASQGESVASPPMTFEKIQELLKARNDTSRFVGLALLKSVLDNGQLIQDPERLRELWEFISPKFLDRLLRARRSDKVTKDESKDMIALSVAVLHTFSILLPEDCRKDTRLIERTDPLIRALIESPPETTKLILQTLLTIVSQPEGALEMLQIEDLSSLTELATQDSLVLDIFSFMWTNASTLTNQVNAVWKSIDKYIPILLTVFKDTDAVTFIHFIGNFIPNISSDALPRKPKWLPALVATLRKLVSSKPTAAGRTAYTQLSAALLQAYPESSPRLLFMNGQVPNADSKPFSYLFVNLLLIDLRSSFPSLLSKLNSSDYPTTSHRLAAAFDVISSFIGFLVRSLDDETPRSPFAIPPDLLLKLRKDIAETMSLTIEYLRDRWDASIAGALGLHPSVRTGTVATSEGTRLTLTWDLMKDNVTEDSLILAGIRTLAIWIREDENENLRNESAGLMDMLIELYKSSSLGTLDFRYPVLLALEGIMITDDGVDVFLGQDGWQVIFDDLDTILKTAADDRTLNASSEAARGLQIVRVLLAVIDHESTHSPREDWMIAVTITASMKRPSTASPPIIIEFQIAMLQLSTALLSKASDGMQKRYVTSTAPLFGLATQLETVIKVMNDKIEAVEFEGLLEDVMLDLENLRFSL